MKKIYFVRHGETDSNVNQIFSGSGNDAMLTDKGKSQAGKAGKSLNGKGIEMIVCSPMTRTKDTAAIIAGEIGFDKSKILVEEMLTERGFGYYEGKSHSVLQEDEKQGTVKDTGEAMPELYNRVAKAMKWLAARSEKTILVVSHGGTGRMFRVVDRNLGHDDFHIIERFENCEIDEFTL